MFYSDHKKYPKTHLTLSCRLLLSPRDDVSEEPWILLLWCDLFYFCLCYVAQALMWDFFQARFLTESDLICSLPILQYLTQHFSVDVGTIMALGSLAFTQLKCLYLSHSPAIYTFGYSGLMSMAFTPEPRTAGFCSSPSVCSWEPDIPLEGTRSKRPSCDLGQCAPWQGT